MPVYIEKVEIQSGVTDAWQTDRQQNIVLLSSSTLYSLSWVTQFLGVISSKFDVNEKRQKLNCLVVVDLLLLGWAILIGISSRAPQEKGRFIGRRWLWDGLVVMMITISVVVVVMVIMMCRIIIWWTLPSDRCYEGYCQSDEYEVISSLTSKQSEDKNIIQSKKIFPTLGWMCFMFYSCSLIKFLIMKVAENEND